MGTEAKAEIIQAIGKEGFDGLGRELVQHLAVGDQQRLIGHFPGGNVLEQIAGKLESQQLDDQAVIFQSG